MNLKISSLMELIGGIEAYELEKKRYESKFEKLYKQHRQIRHLESLPGVGIINATKIMAIVLDARRFPDRGHFLSYCGLVKLDKISGGRSYGKKNPRYNGTLKYAFKTAAMSISIHPESALYGYYQHLVQEKKYPVHTARHALARRVATLAYGVLKTGKRYQKERALCSKT